ncbi:MAG: hypothetical protein KY468_17095 [Armatimonadetes bacterium]|nr:hypothetical protein [Armatimonadota bacterium]
MVAREAVVPVPVTGRRYRRREKYTERTMRRAMLFGTAAITALLAYTIPYATAAREGYQQNKIRTQIQELSRDNEVLQTELASLKNPQIIEAYAAQNGMVMREKAQFVTLPQTTQAAPQPSLLARLSAFSFR